MSARAAAIAMMMTLAAPALGQPVDGGAQVSVQVERNGDTTVDVKRGSVKIKSGGRETHVSAGDTVHAASGKPLRRLLAAPAPLGPADGSLQKSADVPLLWQNVPGAVAYAVEFAASADFATVTHAERQDKSPAVIKLPAGTWYWRVVAVDGDGTRGKASPPRKLTIDTTPPKLKAGKPEWR
jgi:hypothetical protein